MIIHDVIQNTPEWEKIRLGIPTASRFGDILTPARGDLSKSAEPYENMLVAERITGERAEEFGGNFHTERGHELEPEAVALYEMLKEIDVTHGQFVTNDDKTFGASPDGFAGEEGLLEIKCLAPKNHVAVLLKPSLAVKYKPQRQGQLLVTERKWVDNMFYHPKMKPVIIREYRDDDYIAKLEKALNQIELNIKEKVKRILE